MMSAAKNTKTNRNRSSSIDSISLSSLPLKKRIKINHEMNQYLHKCISPDMSVSTMGISSAPTPTIVTTESSTKEEASDVMIQREEDVQLCNMNVTIPKKNKYGDSKKRKLSTDEVTSRASSPTVKDIYKNVVCMGYFSKALSSSSQKMNSCKEVQTPDETNAQHQNHNNNVADSTKKRSVLSHHNQSVKSSNKSINQHDALSLLHKAYLQALNQTSC